MGKQKETCEKINVFIPKKDLAMLRKKAENEDCSVSRLVRLLVKEFVARGEADA